MNNRSRLVIVNLLIIVVLAACAPLATKAPRETPNTASLQEIDGYLTKITANKAFSGAVLLAKDGEILLSKGYGLADQIQKTPITSQTRFRIYSISKQFTAMAILMLQNKGKLNVQDNICTYLKNCPPIWETITIHQLLTHTSGIPDYFHFSDFEAERSTPITPSQFVDWVRNRPLDFQPGEKYSYSNSAYNLLGVIIENLSGQSYGDFLKEHIFNPINMADSGYDPKMNNLATGYKTVTFGYKADYTDPSILYSSAGLYSTTEDLFKWDQALYTEKLLPQKLLDEMFGVQLTIRGSDQVIYYYGYGWFISDYNGHRLVFHSGGSSGFTADILRFTDDKVTMIILSNVENLQLTFVEDFIKARLFK